MNYDLPWNPQRIEQRIGRCHRYGQRHDVVVVNFLNRKNAADQRVYELLAEKFQLFEGVFGASDAVLGAIESGVDFAQRIAAIYLNHPLAEALIARAKGRDLPPAEVRFDYAGHPGKISDIEPLIGRSDRQIREARRAATAAVTLEDKLAGQREVKALEAERNRKRRSLFEAQDEVDRQREALIDAIEGKLTQSARLGTLFTIRWSLDSRG